MPVDIDALLQPISDSQPTGSDLRNHPIYLQIREARRQEEDLNQGVWAREVKEADFPQALKLCKEALTKRGKDLQVAAWLTEALVRLEGFNGLSQGLTLIARMMETYWDSVYPQIDEDGDLELRATALRWVASQLDSAVRSVAITKGKHNWYQYKQSRAIPGEEVARMDSMKAAAREEALREGQVPPEEFDRGLEATSVEFLRQQYELLNGLLERVQSLGEFCDQKFADASPDFGPLRTCLEDVATTTRVLFKQRGGSDQPVAAEAAEAEPEFVEEAPPIAHFSEASGAAAAPALVKRRTAGGIEPDSQEDAIERILAAAKYLRRENPLSPSSYLITRSLRWGELRACGGYPDPALLAAPSSDVRISLKRLAAEGDWDQVRELAEDAAGQPCGRAWLDLQRYACFACQFVGANGAMEAILAALKSLLADLPQLLQWTLADDTPTANPETVNWLRERGVLAAEKPPEVPEPQPPIWYAPPESLAGGETSTPPDAYELAMQSARSGNLLGAFEILSRELAQEPCGRDRFLRKLQVARLCLATGNDAIAEPVLKELAQEIDRRNLAEWELAEVVAEPLTLLYRCLERIPEAASDKRELYARICRLHPASAVGLAR